MPTPQIDEISRLELLNAAHPDGLVFPYLADAYRRASRYDQAETLLQAGLRRHGDCSPGHVVLGRLRLDQGRAEEAERSFRRVLELDPENQVALGYLGRLSMEQGRLEDALHRFRQLSLLRPSDELTAQIGKLEQRVEALRSADGGSAASHDNGTRSAGNIPRPMEPPSEAHQPAAQSEEDPPLPHLPEPGEVVTETMAELYTRRGLHTRAAAVYRQLLQRAPGDERLCARLSAAEEEALGARGETVSGAHEAASAAPADGRRSGVPVDGRPGARSAAAVPGAPVSLREYLGGVVSWQPSPSKHGEAPLRVGPEPRSATLIGLADMLVGLLEYQDPFFRGGSSLTRLVAERVGQEMRLSAEERLDLSLAAVLRDLGRLAMGGQLVTESSSIRGNEVRRKMERHVDLTLHLIEGIEIPESVRLAVRHHHERWDGQGYPDRLTGEQVPRLARILAVVDSFVAMVSPRPYRVPRKVPDAVRELKEAAGTQYDPAVVDSLVQVLAKREHPGLGFAGRHHILLVNPDQPGAAVTAAKLCSAGYLAEVVADADRARERLRRVPVAAVVISAEVGGVESAILTRDIRVDAMFSALPIMVVDAGTVSLRARLLESGADVCFPPGIAHAEFQGTLGALIRRTFDRGGSEVESREAPWPPLQGIS